MWVQPIFFFNGSTDSNAFSCRFQRHMYLTGSPEAAPQFSAAVSSAVEIATEVLIPQGHIFFFFCFLFSLLIDYNKIYFVI